MSKGGAGKVYFVLYLAVVLELLIIIVERDEAEEHLHAKQKETMKIVQSILSQLQSGSGTEGVNTRPQEEIMMNPAGMSAAEVKEAIGQEIKSSRKYVIEVGVADVSQDAKKKEEESPEEYQERLDKLVEISNVAEIEYQIFYNPSTEVGMAPDFPTEEEFKEQGFQNEEPGTRIVTDDGEVWELLSSSVLDLNLDATIEGVNLDAAEKDPMHPVYKDVIQRGPVFAPQGTPADKYFYYDRYETVRGKQASVDTTGAGKLNRGIDKRAFVVNFEPPTGRDGWYKLRFDARTNRILGVKKPEGEGEFEVSDEATVNIGTVQLKVKDLKTVHKQLSMELDRFGLPETKLLQGDESDEFDRALTEAKNKALEEGDIESKGQIELYGYISKLVTPGQSRNFEQNKGAIEFDIRVTTPKPEVAPPGVTMPSEFNRFDALAASIEATVANYNKNSSKIQGFVYDAIDGVNSSPVAQVTWNEIADEGLKNFRVTGTVNKKLDASPNGGPKKYIVKVMHQLGSKTDESTAPMYVYNAVDESKNNKIDVSLRNYGFYGENLIINGYEPPSGNKIKANEFTTRFKTSSMGQPKEISGFNVSPADELYFDCKTESATLSIYWTDPVTGKEVFIYPENTFEIRQVPYTVKTFNTKAQVAQKDMNLDVIVTGILIAPEFNVGGKPEDFEVNIKPKLEVDPAVKGEGPYRATNETLDIDGNMVSVRFRLQGTGPSPSTGKISGTVDVRISGTVTNKCNNTTAKITAGTYTVQISEKVQQDYYQQY